MQASQDAGLLNGAQRPGQNATRMLAVGATALCGATLHWKGQGLGHAGGLRGAQGLQARQASRRLLSLPAPFLLRWHETWSQYDPASWLLASLLALLMVGLLRAGRSATAWGTPRARSIWAHACRRSPRTGGASPQRSALQWQLANALGTESAS